MKFVCAAALAFASALAATPALAAGDAVQGLVAMKELNLIVLGNLTSQSEVEGKTFVGGNLSSANTYGTGASNGQGFQASTDWRTLTVVGSISSGNANINSAITPAGAKVGGSVSNINLNAPGSLLDVGGSVNTNGGNGAVIKAGGAFVGNTNPTAASKQQNLGPGFTSALQSELNADKATLNDDLKALSTALGGLTVVTPSSYTVAGNKLTFNAVDGGDGFAVINVAANVFNAAAEFDYNFAAGAFPVIINLIGPAGATYNWNGNAVGGNNGSANQRVIFNFGDAAFVNLNRLVHGSILAPNAALTNNTAIEGSIVAASFVQGGEVHLGTYNGTTDLFGVPEPATWAMMLLGFFGLGQALRIRRRGLQAA